MKFATVTLPRELIRFPLKTIIKIQLFIMYYNEYGIVTQYVVKTFQRTKYIELWGAGGSVTGFFITMCGMLRGRIV